MEKFAEGNRGTVTVLAPVLVKYVFLVTSRLSDSSWLAGIIGTAHYAAPELLNGFEDMMDPTGNQVETILKSDVYRYALHLSLRL